MSLKFLAPSGELGDVAVWSSVVRSSGLVVVLGFAAVVNSGSAGSATVGVCWYIAAVSLKFQALYSVACSTGLSILSSACCSCAEQNSTSAM